MRYENLLFRTARNKRALRSADPRRRWVYRSSRVGERIIDISAVRLDREVLPEEPIVFVIVGVTGRPVCRVHKVNREIAVDGNDENFAVVSGADVVR